MGRLRRMKVIGEEAYYHLISRTVGGEFYLGDVEKEKLQSIIMSFSKLYFVQVLGFCIMDNHFHLLIKSETEDKYSDEEVLSRLESFYPDKKEVLKYNLSYYRKKLSDISEYMKSIKLTFSRWYNKVNDRKGYFWGDRFKSVLVESGNALLNTLAYIDLNPIRAGIVEKPEDYRWSSIGYRVGTGNKGDFLSFEGIFDKADKDSIKRYRELVYRAGVLNKDNLSSIDLEELEKESDRNFELSVSELCKHRVRYFTDGAVIGSKEFVMSAYAAFGDIIIRKKERKAHKTGITDGLFSLRHLR